jgi:hypothetical protein
MAEGCHAGLDPASMLSLIKRRLDCGSSPQ